MTKAFQLKIDGLKDIIDSFENLQDFKEKSVPLMRKISNELYNASNRAFEKKADPETGVRWADWSPSYYESLVSALSKKNQGKKGKSTNLHDILRKSGELYRKRDRIQEPGLAGVAVKLAYARIHQYGGTVTIGAHSVSEHQVSAHRVKAHTRTVRGTTQTVASHERQAHQRKAHERKGGGSRVIPARPFLGLDSYAKAKIEYLTEQWLMDLLKGKKE